VLVLNGVLDLAPYLTQPKGVVCFAEIEAWQCVRPSGVGSRPANSRASAVRPVMTLSRARLSRLAARTRLAHLAARPRLHITSPSIMASPCHEDHVRAPR
jgi:hypothetical protein